MPEPMLSIRLNEDITTWNLHKSINRWMVEMYAKHLIRPEGYTLYINPEQFKTLPLYINTEVGPLKVKDHKYIELGTAVVIRDIKLNYLYTWGDKE